MCTGPFPAPAKRPRAEHRRPPAERRPHGQFRPGDDGPSLHQSSRTPAWAIHARQGRPMQNQPLIEPTRSPVAKKSPSTMAGRLMSVIRGDKYMIGAYPPAWNGAAAAPTAADVVGRAGENTERAITPRQVAARKHAPQIKERWAMRNRHVPRLCRSWPRPDGRPGRRVLALRRPVGNRRHHTGATASCRSQRRQPGARRRRPLGRRGRQLRPRGDHFARGRCGNDLTHAAHERWTQTQFAAW
jgi:hypothetical protein